MLLYKYRFYIITFFISIFIMKMVISAMPLIICMDKSHEKSYSIDPEQEHPSEEGSKDLLKYPDYKASCVHYSYVFIPLLREFGIRNCYIDHSKRYVNPYHPSVPTPPPNVRLFS